MELLAVGLVMLSVIGAFVMDHNDKALKEHEGSGLFKTAGWLIGWFVGGAITFGGIGAAAGLLTEDWIFGLFCSGVSLVVFLFSTLSDGRARATVHKPPPN